MKHLILTLALVSFSGMVLAEQANTECHMMKEQNDRSNPKAALADKSSQQVKSKSSSAQ